MSTEQHPPNKRPLSFNVGCTWDRDQLWAIHDLNKEFGHKVRVDEVYGSTRYLPSARAMDRIPDVDPDQVEVYVEEARRLGVDIKWTLNQSCVGATQLLKDNIMEFYTLINILHQLGIDKFIVSTPLLLEVVHEVNPAAEVEVSTISRITSLKEIDTWRKLGASGICWDVMQNRDIDMLMNACARAHQLMMYVEVIVNEFCTFMCVHRNLCYNLSSHNSGREAFDGYPFSRCIKERVDEPWQWLATRFIMPSWLRMYYNIGVDKFKMTGRTHPTPEVIRVLRHYMSETDPDNVLDLWHHVNILVGDEHNPSRELFIPSKGLNNAGFINKFWSKGHMCRTNSCYTCGYCRTVYNNIVED